MNTMLKKLTMPEIHISLPSNIQSEQVSDGSLNTTGKYSFCGPITKLNKRLAEGYQGVTSLDEVCRSHDIAYTKYKKTKECNIADDVLAQEACAIALDESTPEYERRDATRVTVIIGIKRRFVLELDDKLIKRTIIHVQDTLELPISLPKQS